MFKETKSYKHLNQDKRNELYQHHGAGIAAKQIAFLLGVDRSTVYRELKRGKHPHHKIYLPDSAQRLSLERRYRPGSKIGRSKQLQQKIREGIAMSLSPDLIAGRLKQESLDHKISHESIYKWIYGQARHLKLYESLVRRKRHRGLRPSRGASKSKIPNRVSIHERPIQEPGALGYWEGDTVHFSKGKGAIVTIYEKTTKVVLGAKMKTKKTEETIDNIQTILQSMPPEIRQTVTFDHGLEFTNHEQLQRSLGVKTYFCDAYASWQKGGVENANGILRRYIPKGSKAEDYSAEKVQSILHRINMTPRKSLNYRSPYEILLKKLTGIDKMIPFFKTSVALRV